MDGGGLLKEAPKLIVIAGLVGVLFFFGLLVLERIPEIPVDIDQKPFFIPFLFAALLPRGWPTVAVALGTALGEGFGDILEGFEPDDPVGFFGYLIGVIIFGFMVAGRPQNRGLVALACVVGAGVQAFIEASAFLIFAEEGLLVALWSATGNTITHGVIWGVIPMLILVPLLHGRIERFLGYPPQGDVGASAKSSAY